MKGSQAIFKGHLCWISGFVLAVLILACVWVFGEGLHGPLVLDDALNLEDITRYLDGDKTAWAVITDNRSGPLGRPISMSTFVADAFLWGDSSWHAKRTNLILHLLIGCLIFLFIRAVLEAVRCPRREIEIGSLLITALWLFHPINVSSVLYLIQRMAQLSTLFMLFGLIVFLYARRRMDRQQASGYLLLWLGVPLLTVAAVLSKENGVLLPLLAFGLDRLLFPDRQSPASQSVRWFFIIFLWVPLLLGIAWLLSSPDRFLVGYTLRDFDLFERLMTQPRVLWSYVAAIVVPQVDLYGVFQDDYVLSRGLLTPATTLPAIMAWVVVVWVAFAFRHRIPLLAAGVWLFLVSHLVESTILPLEIYFEHRNYFGSVGVWLAILGIALAVIKRVSFTPTFKRLSGALAVGFVGILCLFTTNQVHTWKNADNFYFETLRLKPDSFRLHSYLLGRALNAERFEAATLHIDKADRLLSERNLPVIPLWRLVSYCINQDPPTDSIYQDLERRIDTGMTTKDMIAWELLAQRIEAGDCPGNDINRLASTVEQWLARGHVPTTFIHHWKIRYMLARLLASDGQLERGLEQAEKAWVESSYNRGIGILVFQLNASLGRIERCETVLQRLESAIGGGDLAFDRAVARLRAAIESGELMNSDSLDELGSLNPN